MNLIPVTDARFKKYGRIMRCVLISKAIEGMEDSLSRGRDLCGFRPGAGGASCFY